MAPGPDYLSLTPSYSNQFLEWNPREYFWCSLWLLLWSQIWTSLIQCATLVFKFYTHTRPSVLWLSAYITGSDGETLPECKPSRGGWAEHRISYFLMNISAFNLFLHQPRTSHPHSCLSLTGHQWLCLCQRNRMDRLDLREQALAILTNLSTLLVAGPTDIPTPW